MANKSLIKAKRDKKDEFYTQITDIEKEVYHYREHFKDKIVYLNCDDPEESNFWGFFSQQFEKLGLKKLVATHYSDTGPTYKLELTADLNEDGRINTHDLVRTPMKQNGDFRSEESIEILKEADIVVTNPPFSLFREYIAQLIKYEKKFLIVGHQNAITYKEVFPLIRDNKLWLGYGFKGGATHFINTHYVDYATASDHKEGMIRVSGVHWFTNLKHKKRNEDLILYETYDKTKYPTYENYNAINVDKTKEIPKDYKGVMGVPISFLDKWNPKQFEVLGHTASSDKSDKVNALRTDLKKKNRGIINGKTKYDRILIKAK